MNSRKSLNLAKVALQKTNQALSLSNQVLRPDYRLLILLHGIVDRQNLVEPASNDARQCRLNTGKSSSQHCTAWINKLRSCRPWRGQRKNECQECSTQLVSQHPRANIPEQICNSCHGSFLFGYWCCNRFTRT